MAKHDKRIIHPNAPRRLVRAWRDLGCSDRKLAELRGVNQFYVSQLLRRGIEPSNPEIRMQLFLPRRKRQPREPRTEEFPGQKRIIKSIRSLHRKTTLEFKRWRKNADGIKSNKE